MPVFTNTMVKNLTIVQQKVNPDARGYTVKELGLINKLLGGTDAQHLNAAGIKINQNTGDASGFIDQIKNIEQRAAESSDLYKQLAPNLS